MGKKNLPPLLVILVLTFITFGASLWHGFAPFDDFFLVYNNLAIRGVNPQNLWTIFSTYDPELYIPFTLFSFQINYLISGLQPWSYHLLNLLIHASNGLLLFIILKKITKAQHISLLCAVLFTVHPIVVQPVVWITSRKDLLMACFTLLSFRSYLLYISGSKHSYITSILWYALALLSKVSVVAWPLVLIAHDFCIKKEQNWKKMIREKLPFFVLAIVFALIATGGKSGYLEESRPFVALLLSGASVLLYVRNILWPAWLAIIYPFTGVLEFSNIQLLISNILVLLTGIAGAYYSIKRDRILLFLLLCSCLLIGPSILNISSNGDPILGADRHAYLALAVCSIGLGLWLTKIQSKAMYSVGSIVAAVLCITSISYVRIWQSSFHIFEHELNRHPHSISARVSLAKLHREAGNFETAFGILKDGLTIRDHPQLHIAAGLIYAATRNIDDAIEQFTIAKDMDPKNPEPLFNLGSLHEQINRLEVAKGFYEQAIALDPSYVVARAHLANILRIEGDLKNAEKQLRKAMQWNPNSVEVHLYLAQTLLAKEQINEAKEHAAIVLELEPYNEEAKRILRR